MSDIEIGSEWVQKKKTPKEFEVVVLSGDSLMVKENGEGFSIPWYISDFLEHHEPKIKADMVNHPPHYKDASGIEVGSFWHEKQEDSTIGIIHVYEVSNEMILYWMGGERCGCSPDVFLSTFERFESIGRELKNLIEVASRFRDWGEKPSGKSMSENEDDWLDFSQEIIDAVNKYEAASVKSE